MELMEKNMQTLFGQLGEACDDAGIARFIERNGSLSGGTCLHEATCWSPSQAMFLRDAISLDAAWSQVVDALNAQLHRPRGVVTL